jgi:prephenate dehydratase
MTLTIAHLGPSGTYAEAAALAYAESLAPETSYQLKYYGSITQTLLAVAQEQVEIAVVPVENSIEGSVAMTLDTLWLLDGISIQSALILPISHALISTNPDLHQIDVVYSHPQALGQCQEWLEQHLPLAARMPVSSTTASLVDLPQHPTAAAISSVRAANLYQLPILAYPINDRADNCTKFLICTRQPSPGGDLTSIAFSLPRNRPGALVTALGFFAFRGLNLNHIESRPTKRSLGEYLFFIDVAADASHPDMNFALEDLTSYAETVKNFGSYQVHTVN